MPETWRWDHVNVCVDLLHAVHSQYPITKCWGRGAITWHQPAGIHLGWRACAAPRVQASSLRSRVPKPFCNFLSTAFAVWPQEALDQEQLKLGQHLRQEIKARKAAEKATNDSLAAAAAAAAADLSALAGRTDASLARLREKSDGLAAQQKQAQEQQARLVGECSALQQVRLPWGRFPLALHATAAWLQPSVLAQSRLSVQSVF